MKVNMIDEWKIGQSSAVGNQSMTYGIQFSQVPPLGEMGT